ncbi:hypothetical protein C3473_16145 [Mycobacterium kansasii]|nr:hypothetical protein [Mycobacterium kansasii]POX72875.1 hypothetical protein C3475_13730 [Mycobacterium kansasii]POX77429.1 hypothetical protein C3470_22255 [Mycobacterium kansasii]POX78808.1 hypothetical protein C3471_13995 [Mycobacterium kansasii]POX93706.1 hypothetical protein C3473_16145 [Mycobacterium kansasii]
MPTSTSPPSVKRSRQESASCWSLQLTVKDEESQCGWCNDRFGLSWQIVPERPYELVTDPDPTRAAAATIAMFGMRKIIAAELEKAVRAGKGGGGFAASSLGEPADPVDRRLNDRRQVVGVLTRHGHLR